MNDNKSDKTGESTASRKVRIEGINALAFIESLGNRHIDRAEAYRLAGQKLADLGPAGWKVIFLVTIDEPNGFYYLLNADYNRWTTEHNDAQVFATEADAMAVASVIAPKARVLCSAKEVR